MVGVAMTMPRKCRAPHGELSSWKTRLLHDLGIGSKVSANDESWKGLLTYLATMKDRSRARRLSKRLTNRLLAKTGRGIDLAECDLGGLNLEGFDLRKATLNRANLGGTTLVKADLRGASIICAVTERVRADDARFDNVYSHATGYQVANFRGSSWRNARDVTGALFHGCDLRDADLRGAILSGTLFYQCEFDGTQFGGADLAGCVFNECVITATSFIESDLTDVLFLHSPITRSTFARCHAPRSHFNGIRAFAECSFDGADIAQAIIDRSTLCNISFAHVNLEGAVVRDSEIAATDFGAAHAPNITFLRVNATDMLAVNADLRGASWVSSSCKSLVLSGSVLEHARFDACSFEDAVFSDHVPSRVRSKVGGSRTATARKATRLLNVKGRAMSVRNSSFVRCDFRGAYLYRAMFTGDHVKRLVMDGCDFSEAILVQSYLSGSFVGARFRRAELTYARLNQSDFRKADFSNANLFEASLVKVDVGGASFRHVAPPLFFDRAKGLDVPSTYIPTTLRDFIRAFADMLKANRRRST